MKEHRGGGTAPPNLRSLCT